MCVSINNQEFKIRPEIVNNINNSDEPVFYSFSIKTSKCSSSCNNINDPYAKMCVPNVVIIGKGGMKINIDVFAKNWLKKVYVIKDLFGIQVIANVNVINHVTLENI